MYLANECVPLKLVKYRPSIANGPLEDVTFSIMLGYLVPVGLWIVRYIRDL